MSKEYETVDLELDEDTLNYLNKTAKEKDVTLDELINEILEKYMKENIITLSVKDFIQELHNNNHEKLGKKYYIIEDDNKKPIFATRPLKGRNNE